MMCIEEIKNKLEDILTPKRFIHSLNTMNTAVELAKRYGEDKNRAAVAGLLHDCAREIKGDEVFKQCEKYDIVIDNVTRLQPELLHGTIGAHIAEDEYKIQDKLILTAIKYHTTGCENMGLLDTIIFMADYIEPGRTFPEVKEARNVAFNNIDKALLLALDRTIKYILIKGGLIHPDTIHARNGILQSIKGKN